MGKLADCQCDYHAYLRGECATYSGKSRCGPPWHARAPTHDPAKATPEQLLGEARRLIIDRGALRDGADGTRSMAHTVEIFNAITGNKLTEQEGWYFMVAVKIARAVACPSDRDSFVDAAAFMALAGECALSPPRRPNVPTAAREDE